VYVGAILAIIGSEEDFLRGKFGAEYDDYCRRVPRFVPRLEGFGRTLATMPFDWRQVITKEYGTTFAWLTVALALLARQQVAWHGRRGEPLRLGASRCRLARRRRTVGHGPLAQEDPPAAAAGGVRCGRRRLPHAASLPCRAAFAGAPPARPPVR